MAAGALVGRSELSRPPKEKINEGENVLAEPFLDRFC